MSVNGYPERDWPFTFYFNGVELPKWAAQWHWCGFNWWKRHDDDRDDELERFIGWRHIGDLENRLDHYRNIESEDPLILRFACQEVLWLCLTERAEVMKFLKKTLSHPDVEAGAAPAEAFQDIINGAAHMISLSHRDRLAFWTNGGPEDQARLKEEMVPFQFQAAQPPSLEPPHLLWRRRELLFYINQRLSALRRLAQNGTLEKPLRALLNQLPDAD